MRESILLRHRSSIFIMVKVSRSVKASKRSRVMRRRRRNGFLVIWILFYWFIAFHSFFFRCQDIQGLKAADKKEQYTRESSIRSCCIFILGSPFFLISKHVVWSSLRLNYFYQDFSGVIQRGNKLSLHICHMVEVVHELNHQRICLIHFSVYRNQVCIQPFFLRRRKGGSKLPKHVPSRWQQGSTCQLAWHRFGGYASSISITEGP